MATMHTRITQNVEAVRRDIESVRAEMDAVERAPVPLDVARMRLRKYLDDRATLRLSFGRLLGRTFDGRLPPLVPDPTVLPADFERFFVTLFRDHIQEHAEQRLTRDAAASPEPLSDSEQATRLAKLRERLHQLEVREEAWIREAEADGIEFDRRPDADPAVVLGDASDIGAD